MSILQDMWFDNLVAQDVEIRKGSEQEKALAASVRGDDALRETLTETKRASEENIASNISSLYEAMKLSLSSYNQALEALSIQQAAAETAERKKAAGTITQNGYNQIQTALTRARVTVNVRKLDLLKAYVDYQWAVNGLAAN